MNIPDQIIAGDALYFTESFPQDEAGNDLKASDGWTFNYRIINSSGIIQVGSNDIAATADGDDFIFSITSADTANWSEGIYEAYGYMTKSGESDQIIGKKLIEIIANVLTASTYDFRSHARVALDAIEAALERRATKEQMQLSISTGGGSSRAVQFASFEELIKARQYYKAEVAAEVAAEKIANGKDPGGRVLLRF